MYRCRLKEIRLSLFYLLKKDEGRQLLAFLVFKFVDFLCVILSTSINKLARDLARGALRSFVAIVKINRTILMKRKIMS